MVPRIQSTWTVFALAALLFLVAGCFSPLHVAWNDQQPLIGPKVPEPQGFLVIFSERYVIPDEGVPIIYRRPVSLYTKEGRRLGEYQAIGEGSVRLTLPPGEYIVVSESNWALRRVQVHVQDGRTTTVPESLIEQAATVSSR